MTTITVIKDNTGKLVGFGQKDRKAYARFRTKLKELEPGEMLTLSAWIPREGWRHKKHFGLLAAVYDAQEQFDDPEKMRAWLQVGAGYCDFFPGPTGGLVAVPRSIAYDKIDDADFELHHDALKVFLRSDRAQSFLWPHLKPMEASEMVESIVRPFEEQR